MLQLNNAIPLIAFDGISNEGFSVRNGGYRHKIHIKWRVFKYVWLYSNIKFLLSVIQGFYRILKDYIADLMENT